MTNRARTGAFLAAGALTLACGGGEAVPPPAPPVAPPPPPVAYQPTPAAAPAPGAMSPFGPLLSDPQAMQSIVSGALAGGAALAGAMLGGEGRVVEQGIQIKARTDAQGMVPAGPVVTARLGAEEHASAALLLEPGRCYTIIGFAAPGVFDYQLHLLSAPPMPPQLLAQSPAAAPHPTLGGGAACVRNPYATAVQVTIDLHVRRGQGLVAAQPYVR